MHYCHGFSQLQQSSVVQYHITVRQYPTPLLCIDDDERMLQFYTRMLRQQVTDIICTTSGREGVNLARERKAGVVLLDLRIPDLDGLSVLKELKELPSPPEVILITGHGTVQTAVEAMKLGAVDFLEKPFETVQLQRRVEPLLKIRALEAENRALKNIEEPESLFPNLLGSSPIIRELKNTLFRLAQSDVPVTITGESGTGKELIARGLHEAGPRRESPFVVVDCGALPESMIESELFGHEKGAFTGADRGSQGLFRAADGGTLFLDEIGELPPLMQTRLLRAVQYQEIRPLGSTRSYRVDVRIVTATNSDLAASVREGSFREDLYHRITGVVVRAPALREHPEDIAEIAEGILKRHENDEHRRYRISEDALALLRNQRWSGNVRELENVLHGTIALLSGEIIDAAALKLREPFDTGVPTNAGAPKAFAETKEQAIDRALKASNGNKRRAAELLGVAESTIYRNLKRRSRS